MPALTTPSQERRRRVSRPVSRPGADSHLKLAPPRAPPPQTISNHLKPSQTYLKPSQTISNHLKPSQTISICLTDFERPPCLCGVISNCLGPTSAPPPSISKRLRSARPLSARDPQSRPATLCLRTTISNEATSSQIRRPHLKYLKLATLLTPYYPPLSGRVMHFS